jgi:hypothetical protein
MENHVTIAFPVAAAALVTFAAAAGAPRTAHLAPGVSFRISASTKVFGGDTPRGQDAEVMRGRGVAVNGRARVEFLAFTPAPQGVTTDDFLIAGDSGHVFVLHSGSQTMTPADDQFGGPAVIALGRVLGGGGRGFPGGFPAGGDPTGGGRGAGGGGRANRGGGGGPPGGGGAADARGGRRGGRGGLGSGFLSQVELLDVSFAIEKLGAGEAIDGRPTQHYRITSDYRILWGEQGIPAHAVTEIWTSDLPVKIPNPFEPLIVAEQSTDGPLIEYALKLRAIRAQLQGTPIKVITTTTLTGVSEISGFQQYVAGDPPLDKVTVIQQTEIRSVTPADVDPKLVATPDTPGND